MKPLLLLDVDGVLNVPSRAGEPGWRTYYRRNHRDEVMPVTTHPQYTLWLAELSAEYRLVWCTSWWPVVNYALAPLWDLPPRPRVRLPDEYTDVPLGLCAKTPYVREWVRGRRLAWVDDDVTEADGRWLNRALTLNVNPDVGLTREHVDQLLAWARPR